MTTYENVGTMVTKDTSGNIHKLYPVTKASAVEGLEEALHTHENADVLAKFTEDESGNVLYDGKLIEGSSSGSAGSGTSIDDASISDTTTWSSNKISEEMDNLVSGKTINANFVSEDGFANIRYYAGKFQYYNEEQTNWVDMEVTGDNKLIIQMTPNNMQFIYGSTDFANNAIRLKWREPSNTEFDGQLLCYVAGVKLIRKQDSSPTSIDDGDLILDIKPADFGKHQKNWFIDDGIEFEINTTYYYRFYPYSDMGIINTREGNTFAVTYGKEGGQLFGFVINQNESDPASMITYIEDNATYQPVHMDYDTGMFDYGTWEDAWFMKNTKPCMLKYDGTVDYYLDPNDYSLKEDGTASDISNIAYEGNVMIQIPKVYYKIVPDETDTNICTVYITDEKMDDDFVCWSHIDSNGNEIDYCYVSAYNSSKDSADRYRSISGQTIDGDHNGTSDMTYAAANNLDDATIWNMDLYADVTLINLLLILIGKSTDTQTVFGNGNCCSGADDSVKNMVTPGSMNNKGLFWGSNAVNLGVKVFGIENYWGNQWRRVLGYIYKSSGNEYRLKMTHGTHDGSAVIGYNTNGDGYIPSATVKIGSSGNGYISSMIFTKYGLLPASKAGSSSTYYGDGLWNSGGSGNFALLRGGSSTNASTMGGVFTTNITSNLTSGYNRCIGTTLSCKPLAPVAES